jgi:hypothetical protein
MFFSHIAFINPSSVGVGVSSSFSSAFHVASSWSIGCP